jgi:hypothetical protein
MMDTYNISALVWVCSASCVSALHSHSRTPSPFQTHTPITRYYFVFATMSGVKSLGVRMCHLQMFKIRPGRTPPQGMLFLAFILMFTMISLNVVLLSLAPQYVHSLHLPA